MEAILRLQPNRFVARSTWFKRWGQSHRVQTGHTACIYVSLSWTCRIESNWQMLDYWVCACSIRVTCITCLCLNNRITTSAPSVALSSYHSVSFPLRRLHKNTPYTWIDTMLILFIRSILDIAYNFFFSDHSYLYCPRPPFAWWLLTLETRKSPEPIPYFHLLIISPLSMATYCLAPRTATQNPS